MVGGTSKWEVGRQLPQLSQAWQWKLGRPTQER